MFIYFWEKERDRQTEHEWGRGRERAGFRLHAASTEPNVGLKLTDCEMTWAEVGCLTDWATQAFQHIFVCVCVCV